jgi:DNA-directed RNA polymerase subunit RPC12/RpoP
MAVKPKTKVKVYKCATHGEQEFLDFTGDVAYCPQCGKQMEFVGDYEE